ncbi:MAG: hypothetical protein ACK5NG_11595 [Chthoniobacterales bacterium]
MASSCFRYSFQLILLSLIAVVITACDSPEATLDRIRREVQSYTKEQTSEKKTAIEASFEKLDKQIDKLAQSGRSIEAKSLKDQRDRVMTEFKQAQFDGAVDQARSAIRKVSAAIKQARDSFSDTTKDE